MSTPIDPNNFDPLKLAEAMKKLLESGKYPELEGCEFTIKWVPKLREERAKMHP